MFDLNGLIGLEITKAKEILMQNGFDDINIISNFEHNDKCDTIIVCAARIQDGTPTLVCGEFFLELKKE